ncbi:hypothetical protein AKJ16_DCAP07058 [Drosera capensis]
MGSVEARVISIVLLLLYGAQKVKLPFEKLVHALRNFPDEVMDPDVILPMAYSIKISRRLEELRLEYVKIHGKPTANLKQAVDKQSPHHADNDEQNGEVVTSTESSLKPKQLLQSRSFHQRENEKQSGQVGRDGAGEKPKRQLRRHHSYNKTEHRLLDGEIIQSSQSSDIDEPPLA